MVVRFFVLFRENSDVITYKVTTLFSVYSQIYRLLRRYPSYYGRESRRELKTKGEIYIYIYEIISLVLFGQRFFNYKYRYNKRYDREKSSMNRAQSFYFDTVKKKKSCQKVYLVRARYTSARCIFTLVVKGQL